MYPEEVALVLQLMIRRGMRIRDDGRRPVLINKLGNVQLMCVTWNSVAWMLVNGYLHRTFLFDGCRYYTVPTPMREQLLAEAV